MQSLINASKSTEGRAQLIDDGVLAEQAAQLSCAVQHWRGSALQEAAPSALAQPPPPSALAQPPPLLLLLRFLRNMCASGPAAATVLLHAGLQHELPQLAGELANRCSIKAVTAGAAGLQLQQQQGQGTQQQPQGVGSGAAVLDQQLLLAAVQLLANFSVSSQHAADAVWEGFWPAKFVQLAAVPDGRVTSALTLALHTCCKASPGRSLQLCSEGKRSVALWLALLAPLLADEESPEHGRQQQQEQQQQQHGNDCLGLLVRTVALQGHLEPLLHCLEMATCTAGSSGTQKGSDGDSYASSSSSSIRQRAGTWHWNRAHVAVLHILADEFAADTAANLDSTGATREQAAATAGGATAQYPASYATLQSLASVLQAAAADAAAGGAVLATNDQPAANTPSSTGSSGSSSNGTHSAAGTAPNADAASSSGAGAAPSTSTVTEPPADGSQALGGSAVLEAVLQVLRALLQREDRGRALCDGCDVALLLLECGAVRQVLALLCALGPPINPRRQQEVPTAPASPLLAGLAATCPRSPPYLGYRSDIVAVLANALFGRPLVQEEVQQCGGVEMLLSSCQLDETSPVAREWALWAVRNMCEGNAAIQAQIAGLEVQSTVDSPELAKMGMEVQMDKATGKLRLVQKQQQ